MFQEPSNVVYVERSHGPFRGPLSFIFLLWAIGYPALLLLLTPLGPIGVVVGIAAAVLLFVPWVVGLLILGVLRWLA